MSPVICSAAVAAVMGSVGVEVVKPDKGVCVTVVTGVSMVTGTAMVTGVRGSGLTMAQVAGRLLPVPAPMASELRITRKCVLSEGVMVTVFGSSAHSFLVTWNGQDLVWLHQ